MRVSPAIVSLVGCACMLGCGGQSKDALESDPGTIAIANPSEQASSRSGKSAGVVSRSLAGSPRSGCLHCLVACCWVAPQGATRAVLVIRLGRTAYLLDRLHQIIRRRVGVPHRGLDVRVPQQPLDRRERHPG